MRKIDSLKLRNYIYGQGRGSKELLAINAKCSVSLIEKLLNQRGRKAPLPALRYRLCQATGIPEDELFPLAEEAVKN